MDKPPAEVLFGQFLHEPDIRKRIEYVQLATAGRSPDEAVSVVFAALNIAVDRLRHVLEIAVLEHGIDSADLIARMQAKADERTSDYIEHHFNTIVQGFDDTPSQTP